ncbi:unnamed protein product [Cochlearia groenlandica]
MMDPVKIICDELKVSREEALYYLEGFNWELNPAIEACRTKTLPQIRAKSSYAPPQSPQTPPSTQPQLIASFCGLTGAETEKAVATLDYFGWDVNTAAGRYLEGFVVPPPPSSTNLNFSLDDIPPLTGLVDTKIDWPNMYKSFESLTSSSSMGAYPTKTEKPLKEAAAEHISMDIPQIASLQVSGKAVEEDSYRSTTLGPKTAQTTTITLTIILADGGSGTEVELPFRSDQTVRDIREAIEERTSNNDGNYVLQSRLGDEYRDLTTTVLKLNTAGSTTLIQIFRDT